MRYLNKIIFINSAHVPYAEIKLDGNVHFIGTQGVGKSTLLRALLFFYNADKLKLGIPQEKKGFDSFYFPYTNSYIIYEVMRENGAYSIMTFKYFGRAAFRFIDAPYDSSWFIDEKKEARSDWFAIREKIGKEHSVSAIVTIYETFRDIIFGNNRRQELMGFRKYAIVESAKYQNIPRTIQNVFLNSKLDADFIKDTIIHSLTDEEIFIDLDFYRRQIKEFEQEYTDVMLWYQKNKNGEIPVRKSADKVMNTYRDLIYVRKQIDEERAELNYAERNATQRLPKIRQSVNDGEEKRAGILKLVNELEQKRAKERDELNVSIGRVDSELKRASRKRQEYEQMNIEEIVRRVGQESIVEKDMERAQTLKNDLTRAYQDIMTKYRQLIEAEEVGLRSFENGKQAQILAKQTEATKKKEEAFNNERQDSESIRKASAEKEQNADIKLQQLREQQAELRQQLVKLQYEEPYGKEISVIEEDLAKVDKREAEISTKIKELQISINGLRQECDIKLRSQENEWEKKIEEIRRNKERVTEGISAKEALIEKWKGSFGEWLGQNIPGWEETIGKVADEESVLYNNGLHPQWSIGSEKLKVKSEKLGDLYGVENEVISEKLGNLYGVEIDLSAIERKMRTPEQLKEELEELGKELKEINVSLTHISEEKEAAAEKLKKKYSKEIRELGEEQHLLEAEQSRIPQKRKNLKSDLVGWKTKTEDWKHKQGEVFQGKLNESGRQIYLAEEEKKRVVEDRERQLKACQKQYRDRTNAIAAETERFVTALIQEVEERKKLSSIRIHTLASDRDAELSGKGGDMNAIRKVEAQIEELSKEMEYIKEHRTVVAYYIKDKQELFDQEPTLKSRKKELEEKLAALDARYALRNEKYKIQLKQVEEELSSIKKELNELEDGLVRADKFRSDSTFCPTGSMDVGERITRKSCTELTEELKSLIVSAMNKTNDFKKSVTLFTGFFSAKNTFNFRTELVSEEDYFDFASNLCEFVDNNKIADFQKQISERYTNIIRRISQEVGNMTRNKGEINKTMDAINSDFVERNFSGVIKEISLRQMPSSDKLMQLLLEIKKFNDENQYNMGEADLFTEASREEVNQSAVRYLLSFMRCLVDDPSRSKLELSDTFNLEFRVKENDNDTGWVEKIANVGSDGTDVLVKAMVNIMLINVFKEKSSRKFGDFKLHCMMDEIGKLHPTNVKGILEFANCRNILLVNGSPTTYNVSEYRHTYLLSKDSEANTRIVPLISHK